MGDMSCNRNIVILTGAGVSAESGIDTFRSEGGLWEQHKIEDVATPEAFQRDPDLVLRFYDMRREAIQTKDPNPAHEALAGGLASNPAGARLREACRVLLIPRTCGVPQMGHYRPARDRIVERRAGVLHLQARAAATLQTARHRAHEGARGVCYAAHTLTAALCFLGFGFSTCTAFG